MNLRIGYRMQQAGSRTVEETVEAGRNRKGGTRWGRLAAPDRDTSSRRVGVDTV